MATPGDTFVLDMGDPVRIVQLARDLIELHGLEPERDVELEFIGQRPGEKLVEELYFAEERPEPTAHEAVRCVRNTTPPFAGLVDRIERLRDLAEQGQRVELLRCLQLIVPEYRPGSGDDLPERTAKDGR